MPEQTSLDAIDDGAHVPVFDADEPRTVLRRLEEGETVPEHDHPEYDIVFQLVSGDLELVLDGESYDLSPDDLVQFDGQRTISGHARADTTALIVFAPKA